MPHILVSPYNELFVGTFRSVLVCYTDVFSVVFSVVTTLKTAVYQTRNALTAKNLRSTKVTNYAETSTFWSSLSQKN